MTEAQAFMAKAEESLASAEDDYAKGRYNACARNAYYAVFQAAVSALTLETVRPVGYWGHDYVGAQFSGLLINRRKLYPARLRDLLPEALRVRSEADYSPRSVSGRRAGRILNGVRDLLGLVRETINGSS